MKNLLHSIVLQYGNHLLPFMDYLTVYGNLFYLLTLMTLCTIRLFTRLFLKIICKSKTGSMDTGIYNEFIVKKWNKPKSEKKWELVFHLYVDQNWWKKCYHLVFRLTRDIQ